MIPQILFSGAYALPSSGAVLHYFSTHLMDRTEAGALLSLSGYLDTEDHVVPIVLNRDLWEEIGLRLDETQLPEKLLFNVCQGMDLHGVQIANIAMYAAPKEFILTLHCEVSEAFEVRPEVGWKAIAAMAKKVITEMESRATRVRGASGEREWRPARMLAVLFIHGRNQEDEPHFHGHLVVFPIVREVDLGWRAYHDGESFLNLNAVDGLRAKGGAAACREAAKHGFKITYKDGLASLTEPNGATVECPDGHVIEAGTVYRKRTALILAHKRLKEFLHVPALTKREVMLVQGNPGLSARELPGVTRPAKLEHKLRGLGLLDEDEKIHSGQKLVGAIKRVDESMAMAQASLIGMSPVSKVQSKALGDALESRRKDLVKGFPELSLQNSSKSAKIQWTRSFTRLLQEVHDAGREGLSLSDVREDDHDTFLVLLRAHLLHLEVSNGRRAAMITEIGEQRLAEVKERVRTASEARYDLLAPMPWGLNSSPVRNEPPRKVVLIRKEGKGPEKGIKHEVTPTQGIKPDVTPRQQEPKSTNNKGRA